MIEQLFRIFMGLAFVAISCHCFLAIFVKRLRMNWRGTNIQTGAISNLGFGCFFLMGSVLTLFVHTPIDSFWAAMLFVVVPAVTAWSLAFKGYKIDVRESRR